MGIIALQLPLRPVLRRVFGNVDFNRFKIELERIDEVLRISGIEDGIIFSRSNQGKESSRALRCMILKSLLGESYRGMSRRLAECELFQWFCGFGDIHEVRVPSKSKLQEYSKWMTVSEVKEIMSILLRAVSEKDKLSLLNDVELGEVWCDSTCIEHNIHFPVDWVLLRDAVRTLMKSTSLIRKRGLKCRMLEPEIFLREINKLCIEMTHSSRKKGAKRLRKNVLRRMKRLVKVVEKHALRHRELLDREWQKTDWTRRQTEVVIGRIDGIIRQLPKALKQAHERIIGERKVESSDKILSLYEHDTRIIVRGKANARVEFGNSLYIAEQAQGLIVDWKYFKESAPADSSLVEESLERIEKTNIKVTQVTADRGFYSADNTKILKNKNIQNFICPKNPKTLSMKLENKDFVKAQKRRASTEARIAIFKNSFIGKKIKAKGFYNQESQIAWNLLAHNLWVVARMEKAETLKKAA